MLKLPKDLDRFFSYVKYSEGCWLWQGSVNRKDYGCFSLYCKTRIAHRLSYQYFIGRIPKGLFVCHRCDEPRCVNPFHLFIGTNKENQADMYSKGRKPPVTHCKRGHEFTEKNTIIANNLGHRDCKKCKTDCLRKFRDKNRDHRNKQARGYYSAKKTSDSV